MDRLLRIKEVKQRVGWSEMTIWRKERDGVFPKRVKIGPNTVAWLESEIDRFIADQVTRRDTSRSNHEAFERRGSDTR